MVYLCYKVDTSQKILQRKNKKMSEQGFIELYVKFRAMGLPKRLSIDQAWKITKCNRLSRFSELPSPPERRNVGITAERYMQELRMSYVHGELIKNSTRKMLYDLFGSFDKQMLIQ